MLSSFSHTGRTIETFRVSTCIFSFSVLVPMYIQLSSDVAACY